MRICSFLPSATEILFAIGAGEDVVGVTHECGYPPEAAALPRVISSAIDHHSLSSAEIDKAVAENYAAGKSTYIVDLDKLNEARPDLIVTQELCEVCAVTGGETVDAIKALDYTPEVISLYPKDLEGVIDNITTLGEATGNKEGAAEVVGNMRRRIGAVSALFKNERDRPRVFAMEWLEPPFVGGHWAPEMIELAGGDCVMGEAGEPSRKVSWEEIEDSAPQVVVIMSCGFDVERTLEEIDLVTGNPVWNKLSAVRKGHVYIVDADSFFSKPGPRLVDGLEILARIIHPESCDYFHGADSVLNLRNYLHFQLSLG